MLDQTLFMAAVHRMAEFTADGRHDCCRSKYGSSNDRKEMLSHVCLYLVVAVSNWRRKGHWAIQIHVAWKGGIAIPDDGLSKVLQHLSGLKGKSGYLAARWKPLVLLQSPFQICIYLQVGIRSRPKVYRGGKVCGDWMYTTLTIHKSFLSSCSIGILNADPHRATVRNAQGTFADLSSWLGFVNLT